MTLTKHLLCKHISALYLDSETDTIVREASRQSGEPTSKWIGDAIRQRLRAEWPADVLAIFGTWPKDFPETDNLRQGLRQDAERESCD